MSPVPPAPGRPPRRRPRLRHVLIILGVVLVVCCGGAVAAGYWLLHSANVAAPRAAADAFLDDLKGDDTAAAYGLLCNDERNRLTQAAFADQVHAQPRLTGYRIVSASVSVVNGTQTALVTADLTRAGAPTERHTLRLVMDPPKWHVCGDPY